ncbi:Bidirectional sugar transporter SWEET1 [Sesamum alatum]|uniref:Bidirectional sugar transporter SWEET n=1 Tax=Sesamum alatum TaxID=300844 RepID=A0AAE2CT90_9LAMI|nr:Bidirectional sugar transporter SWEET1 [Sesamum alatum]
MPERNLVTWNSVVSGLVKGGNMELANKVFQRMPERNSVSWNAMISGYIKLGDLKSAKAIFDEMPERSVVSWTTMVSGDALHLTFGIIGNATGLFLFLSPTVTFKRIIAKRSTEQFSGVPYVMTLLNCLLAAWYGLPFITTNNYLVSAVNGVGILIESVYVVIFLIFAPKKEKAKILGLLVCILALFSAVASVSFLALHKEKQRKLVCGFASSIFSIIMYASPLSVMRVVIKTKSVEYMPFLLSFFVFLCGCCWLVYGLIGKDIFLIVPNGFGTVLGAMQLILYAIYCRNEGEEAKKPTKDGSLEMGLSDPYQLPKQPNCS